MTENNRMNSLKSIFSRITSVPGAISAMSDVGVSIEDMGGGLRDVDDILGDLGGKWGSLSREQQQNLGLQIAGRYQLSRFLILMENWDQALSATDTALHSNGSAMQENERYMDSYEAKINKVKNAWTESTLSLQESFLGDAILGFTATATGFINIFTKVIDTVGLLPAVLGTVGLALTLFGVNLNELSGKALTATIGGIGGLTKSIRGMGLEARKQVASLGVLQASLKGLRTLVMSPMGALMFAGWGISYLISKISEAKQASEELERQNAHTMASLQNERGTVEDLVSEYERLSNIERNIEQEERYVALQNELGQLLPQVVTGEDHKGNMILTNSDIVRKHIELLDEQIKKERELALTTAESDIATGLKDFKKANDALDDHQQKLSELQNARQKFEEANNGGVYSHYYETEINKLDKQIATFKEKAQDALDDKGIEATKLADAWSLVASEAAKISEFDASWVATMAMDMEYGKEEAEKLAIQVAGLKDQMAEGFSLDIISDVSQLEAINGISTTINEGGEAWKEYAADLRSVGFTSDEVSQILGFLRHTTKEVADAAVEMGDDVDATQPVFDSLGEKIINFATAAQEASDETDGFSDSMEGAEESADAYARALKNAEEATWDNVSASEMLTGATHEQIGLMEQAIEVVQALGNQSDLTAQQKEYLTEAVNYLTDMYPHLDGAISENIGWLIDEANMLSQLSGASGDNADVMMSNQDSVTSSTINASNQRIKKLISEANTLRQLVANYEKVQSAKIFNNIMNPKVGNLNPVGGRAQIGGGSSAGKQNLNNLLNPMLHADSKLKGTRELSEYNKAKIQLEKIEAELSEALSTRQGAAYGSGGLTKSSGLLSNSSKKSGGSKKKPKKSGSSKKTPKSKSNADKRARETEKAEREAAKRAEEAQKRVLEIINAQIDAYNRKADALNANIAHEEYYLSKYESTSQQYRQRQQNIAQLKKQQADYHLDTIKYIEGQLKGNRKLNNEQRIELQKTLTSTKQAYYSSLQSVESINKDIKKSYEDIADEFIQIYKDVHEEMKKVALKANQDELDSLQKNFDKKIGMLNEELSKYEEIIQAKLDLIDDEKDQEDFQKELNKKQEERIDLIRQIDVLSMDDSMEARSKVADLKELLDEKDLEIKEFVADRERELRKESLLEQLEDKREQIEAEQEMEEEKFEGQKLELEKQREQIEQHYEDLLNDERKFAKMRQDILNGNIKSMTKMLKGFSSDIGKNMDTIGKSISNNLIDRISEAQKKLNSVTSSYKKMETKVKAGTKSPANPKGSSSSSSAKSNSKKKTPKVGGRVKVSTKNASAYLDSYGKQVRPWAQQAKAAGVGYGQGLHMVNKRGNFAALSKTKSINGAIAWVKMKDLVGLNTGGMTGNFQGGRVAELHSNELVSNPVDTKNLISASKFASDFMSKMPSFSQGESGKSVSNTNHNKIELNIEMNGVNDSESLFKEINSDLGDMGVKLIT